MKGGGHDYDVGPRQARSINIEKAHFDYRPNRNAAAELSIKIISLLFPFFDLNLGVGMWL